MLQEVAKMRPKPPEFRWFSPASEVRARSAPCSWRHSGDRFRGCYPLLLLDLSRIDASGVWAGGWTCTFSVRHACKTASRHTQSPLVSGL